MSIININRLNITSNFWYEVFIWKLLKWWFFFLNSGYQTKNKQSVCFKIKLYIFFIFLRRGILRDLMFLGFLLMFKYRGTKNLILSFEHVSGACAFQH